MKNILLCMVVNCGVICAMNCPIQLPVQLQVECDQFYHDVRLDSLRYDTDQLQISVKSDADFIANMKRFATNIMHLNNILMLLKQGDGRYSPMIRVKFGRELGSFLIGTRNLLIKQKAKERLIKLREQDLIDQLSSVGLF